MLPLRGMTGVILAEIRAFIFSMSSHLQMICLALQQIIRRPGKAYLTPECPRMSEFILINMAALEEYMVSESIIIKQREHRPDP